MPCCVLEANNYVLIIIFEHVKVLHYKSKIRLQMGCKIKQTYKIKQSTTYLEYFFYVKTVTRTIRREKNSFKFVP
jgi:hypothetical protein